MSSRNVFTVCFHWESHVKVQMDLNKGHKPCLMGEMIFNEG
jgi:hypothetical protein